MFISILDIFKVGIGPSSSHTMGPLAAALMFLDKVDRHLSQADKDNPSVLASLRVRVTLFDSLALTGKGHATDKALLLGMHGYTAYTAAYKDVDALVVQLKQERYITTQEGFRLRFDPVADIVFDTHESKAEQHPNGMTFKLVDAAHQTQLEQTYFSIGGGFVCSADRMNQSVQTVEEMRDVNDQPVCPYPFDSAAKMLDMAKQHGKSIAEMKYANEAVYQPAYLIEQSIDSIWNAMRRCVQQGLEADGVLPGSLQVKRRAKRLYAKLTDETNDTATVNEWLSAYAMAVNEENAAGHLVVTAPTNGAAGVIAALLYYLVQHEKLAIEGVRTFLLTAAAIGGLIKHRSSISGAEVGCQGEVGTASAMAAAGMCAVRGGTATQVENAAEMALEHHLGMTCDPVAGLVQVPCIERNAFGAIKAYSAAVLALHGDGQHFMPFDACIEAMRQTGKEMSAKYKETSLGGLAVSVQLPDC